MKKDPKDRAELRIKIWLCRPVGKITGATLEKTDEK